jgi:glycosyltransferase involved in cell wall biosynthesis
LVDFCDGTPDLIYGNTIASGQAYGWLRKLGVPILTHFHELEMSIKRYGSQWIEDVLERSSHFVACSKPVCENLINNHNVNPASISTIYASIPSDPLPSLSEDAKKHLKKELGLLQDRNLVFGCGLGMPFRKGADLFIEVARVLRQKGYDNFHFYWIGDFDWLAHDDKYGNWSDYVTELKQSELSAYVTFLGFVEKPKEYLRAADVFILPSREDPFPLVALEAADFGLPVICFAGAGGMPDFVGEDAGFVVPFGDVEAMAERVIILLADENLRHALGSRGREKLISSFTVEKTAPKILSTCRKVASKKPGVSVIVPNYNHAQYLPQRLESIFNQTYRDFEVILLDDASSDNSMEVLEKYADRVDVRIVKNEHNSGSSFRQWLKGIDLASSDILWIAESDDRCEPEFLESLLTAFDNPNVKLAYTNSYIMNEVGEIAGDYAATDYLKSLSQTKWENPYHVSAEQEINDGLGVKNTILNVSSVLFRKFTIDDKFRDTLEGMRIAGDWYFIVNAIKGGEIKHYARKLNYHRRHSESVIGKILRDKKLEIFFREFWLVQEYIFNNYQLAPDFVEKWERYLRQQWNDFCPKSSFEELENYYPFNKMREVIVNNTKGSSKN